MLFNSSIEGAALKASLSEEKASLRMKEKGILDYHDEMNLAG